jgi:hypothetical protein
MSYYETVEDEVVSEGEEESEEEEEVVVVPKRRKQKKWKVSYIYEYLHFCSLSRERWFLDAM